jgi:hypothetical protein
VFTESRKEKFADLFMCAHFTKVNFPWRRKRPKIERWFECASEWKILAFSTRSIKSEIYLTWSRFSSRLCRWVAGWMMQKISCRENRITYTFLHPSLDAAVLRAALGEILRNSLNDGREKMARVKSSTRFITERVAWGNGPNERKCWMKQLNGNLNLNS